MQNFRQSCIKRNLRLRAEVIAAIRRFFNMHGYLEVETPYRLPTQAPEAHIDAEASGLWFLHTSPEVCMKRLLSAGYERIFQICRCFRKHERGQRHLPEMTLLEWYREGADYRDLMDETRYLVGYIADSIGLDDSLIYSGQKIEIASAWEKLSIKEAFKRFSTISLEQALAEDRFDEIIAFGIEPRLGKNKPVFLCDYPIEKAALARPKTDNPSIAERFELYISGLELCNGFSELTDEQEQRKRFQEQNALQKALGKTVYPMPEKFLKSLRQMPASAGCALGVDRLVMLFADARNIDDVVAFTTEEL
ncbi:MAG: EF-P lysine aminoacylase EpmA [Desulfobacterales bacterium]